MKDSMTIVGSSFPVIDITHKPKRYQAENVKATEMIDRSDPNTPTTSSVPNHVTVERAIQFYESNAEGEYKNLYLQTAKWLREYMSRTIPVPSDDDKVRGGN